ncbi:MAG: TM2 domain-containing protein [Actinomycetia bacterium]|nr:TM2 domain-containing protein [Actinomycetes bacterium]
MVRGSFCRACGEPIDPRAEVCVNCGVRQYALSVRPYKSRITAGFLALFLGGVGAHHFYLGQTGLGILYLLFFWTFIPGIIAFFEALVFFFQSDASFDAKYNS